MVVLLIEWEDGTRTGLRQEGRGERDLFGLGRV